MIKAATLPTQERLQQLLNYDPITGQLTWRTRSPGMFSAGKYSAERKAAAWNRKHAGKPCFNTRHNGGYLDGYVDGKKYLAHRIIWKLTTGEEPSEVSHRDGDGLRNQNHNLQASDRKTSMRNRRIRGDSASGVIGVYPKRGRWAARIKIEGQFLSLGTFATIAEAAAVRQAKQRELGFGSRHGTLMSGEKS